MLKHPTMDKLQTLKLTGMSKAMEEQLRLPEIQSLSFEERLGLLVDQELTERQNRRLQTRLRQAKLRQQACLEDIDWRAARGLDKHMMMDLAACRWIKAPHNVLILGPTGVGKTYLACALAQQACREGYRVQLRTPVYSFSETGVGKRRRPLSAALGQLDQGGSSGLG
jgi:DNA replication protein DnaC